MREQKKKKKRGTHIRVFNQEVYQKISRNDEYTIPNI
jgi:hypothetical protein